MVIIGNFVEIAERRDLKIIGDTPELATRLLISAEPDTVVIESCTKLLLGGLFDCRS
jgi:hypothetical protein